MKNRKVIGNYTDTGESVELWHSRSVGVSVIITDGRGNFLLERRGLGCPDFIGKLCCPCGYLDWDENLEEAAVREVYEETGLEIEECFLRFFDIESNPDAHKQNVTVRYSYHMSLRDMKEAIENFNNNSEDRGGEEAEVSELVLYTFNGNEEHEEHESEFAFNHAEVIARAYKYI